MLHLASTDDKGSTPELHVGTRNLSLRCPANAFRTPPNACSLCDVKCTARKELHRCGCRIKLHDAIKCPYFIGYQEPGIYVRQEVGTSGVLSTPGRRHGAEVAEDRIE
jgi:hypothetical protein